MRLFFDPESVESESEVHRLASKRREQLCVSIRAYAHSLLYSVSVVLLSIVTSTRILLSFMELILQRGPNPALKELYASAHSNLAVLVQLEEPLRCMLGEAVSPSLQEYSLSQPGIIDHDELASLCDTSAKSVAIGSWSRAFVFFWKICSKGLY